MIIVKEMCYWRKKVKGEVELTIEHSSDKEEVGEKGNAKM